MSHIVAAFCIGILANTADALGLEPDNNERVRAMITFLDGEDWQFDKTIEAFRTLSQLAPSDIEAQNATVRYLERAASPGARVPISYARLLSQYGDGFGEKVIRSLTMTKSSELSELWLVTLALMGRRASKQVEPLTRFLHQQDDAGNKMMARIAIAMMGAALPDNSKIIEKEIHERTGAGRAAVRMAALVGFREWASAKSVSEIQDWLTRRDVSEDDRCMAAVALAVSDCRDEIVERNIRVLLAEAMKDSDSSARIGYAYALALLDPDHAARYWRVILKKLLPNEFSREDAFAILELSVSIPAKQITIVNRLRNDLDSEIAEEAIKLGKLFEEFLNP